MQWRARATMADFLHDKVRNRTLEFTTAQSGIQEFEPRWKECVATTAKHLPHATGSLYVREYFSEKSKESAIEMVDLIKNEFKKILQTVPWMDNKTRAAGLRKVEAMHNHIGYPNELMDDKMLIEFYKDIKLEPNEYLKSIMKLNRFRLTSEMEKLRRPVNKTDWETHSEVAVANAYYVWLENSIREFKPQFCCNRKA